MANNVLLNNTDHRDLRVHNRYAPELGDNVMYTPTFAREFKTIQAHYPIVFQKQAQGDTFIPLALLGLENHENLFLTDRRSEEHTSELQSRVHIVCRLLLDTKEDIRW